MALGYARLVWEQTPGPKLTVVAMSLVAGLANGTVLAVINSAIAARVEGTFGWQHIALFVGALVLYLVGSYFAMFRATELAGRLMHRLRGGMVDELARSSVQAVERYGRGDIIAHFSEDIATIGDTALKLVGVVNSIVLTVFCLGYLAVLSPLTLGVTVLFVVVGIGVYFWQEGLAKRLLASARQDEAEYYGSVGDVLGGFKELRLSRAVARDLTRHMERISDRFRRGFAKAEFSGIL